VVDQPGSSAAASDQVLYNLVRRGMGCDLLRWLRQHHILGMTYSPIEQARLAVSPDLAKLAQK
jgi:diketogulonate reductase-like aldo/keto reductase